jgi:hypothetical protein
MSGDGNVDTGPIVPPADVLKTAEVSTPPVTPQAEAAKPAAPEKPNKEQLFTQLEESLGNFSQFTRTRAQNIEETIQEAGSLVVPLFDFGASADLATRALGPITDSRSHDISVLLNQAKNISLEEHDNVERMFGQTGIARRTSELIRDESNNDRFDQILARLKEAEGSTDEVERAAGIDAAKAGIAQIMTDIAHEGNKVVLDFANFKDGSENNVHRFRSRAEEVYQMVPAIRERLEDSYLAIRNNVDNMLSLVQAYRGRTSRLESVPLEFKLINNEANRMGITVDEILEAIKAAK